MSAPASGAAPAAPADATRRAMLAKVHIARKALALDDESYGAVLLRVAGVESARTLDRAQLDAVLAEFRRLGWKPAAGGRPAKLSQKAQVRMIFGVWRDLAPHLTDRSPDALRSFVQRQTRSRLHPDGVSAPEFLDSKQANLVLEGLKAWLARLRRERAARDQSEAAS